VIGLVKDRAKAAACFAHYQGRDDLRFLVQNVCELVSLNGDVHSSSGQPGQSQILARILSSTLLPNGWTHNLLADGHITSKASFLCSSRSMGRWTGRIPIEAGYGYLGPADVCMPATSAWADDVRGLGAATWRASEDVPVPHLQAGMRLDIVRLC
jgi:hypothetical protein